MARTITKLMLASVAAAAAICSEIPASHAYGDAPWCAVIELGSGEAVWDCQYQTVEQCAPNVVAGNRGFCGLNPWPGPQRAAAAGRPTRRRWPIRRY